MKAAAIVLISAAVLFYGIPALVLAAVVLRDRKADRAAARRRAEQDREITPEWLAVLAATDTPIFAEVWADSLRRDLEDWSA